MKSLGLLGGMSWESTLSYYQQINQGVRERRGGLHSAPLLLWSADFAPIAQWQAAGEWGQAGALLAEKAAMLQQAGVAGLILCTNTMHKVATTIEQMIEIPLIHIVDVVGERIRAQGLQTIGLLGTQFTMEDGFFDKRINTFGVELLTPDLKQRQAVHRCIYEELVRGVVSQEAKQVMLNAIEELVRRGAQGVILGCTEIGLVVKPQDVQTPVFDSTVLHAQAAVDFIVSD